MNVLKLPTIIFKKTFVPNHELMFRIGHIPVKLSDFAESEVDNVHNQIMFRIPLCTSRLLEDDIGLYDYKTLAMLNCVYIRELTHDFLDCLSTVRLRMDSSGVIYHDTGIWNNMCTLASAYGSDIILDGVPSILDSIGLRRFGVPVVQHSRIVPSMVYSDYTIPYKILYYIASHIRSERLLILNPFDGILCHLVSEYTAPMIPSNVKLSDTFRRNHELLGFDFSKYRIRKNIDFNAVSDVPLKSHSIVFIVTKESDFKDDVSYVMNDSGFNLFVQRPHVENYRITKYAKIDIPRSFWCSSFSNARIVLARSGSGKSFYSDKGYWRDGDLFIKWPPMINNKRFWEYMSDEEQFSFGVDCLKIVLSISSSSGDIVAFNPNTLALKYVLGVYGTAPFVCWNISDDLLLSNLKSRKGNSQPGLESLRDTALYDASVESNVPVLESDSPDISLISSLYIRDSLQGLVCHDVLSKDISYYIKSLKSGYCVCFQKFDVSRVHDFVSLGFGVSYIHDFLGFTESTMSITSEESVIVYPAFMLNSVVESIHTNVSYVGKLISNSVRSSYNLSGLDGERYRSNAAVLEGATVFDDGSLGFLKNDSVYPLNPSGHMIGMILASAFRVVDFVRYLKFIEDNLLGFVSDAEGILIPFWHSYYDYKISIRAASMYMKDLELVPSVNLSWLLDKLFCLKQRHERFNNFGYKHGGRAFVVDGKIIPLRDLP